MWTNTIPHYNKLGILGIITLVITRKTGMIAYIILTFKACVDLFLLHRKLYGFKMAALYFIKDILQEIVKLFINTLKYILTAEEILIILLIYLYILELFINLIWYRYVFTPETVFTFVVKRFFNIKAFINEEREWFKSSFNTWNKGRRAKRLIHINSILTFFIHIIVLLKSLNTKKNIIYFLPKLIITILFHSQLIVRCWCRNIGHFAKSMNKIRNRMRFYYITCIYLYIEYLNIKFGIIITDVIIIPKTPLELYFWYLDYTSIHYTVYIIKNYIKLILFFEVVSIWKKGNK